MQPTLRATALIPVLILAACKSSPSAPTTPPPGLGYAAASRGCTPFAGPALYIYLAGAPVTTLEPAAPYLRVDIWQEVSNIQVSDWAFGSEQDLTSAGYHPATGPAESATSGSLHLGTIGTDTSVSGTLDLYFPTAGHIRGTFQGNWISRTVVC